MENEKIIALSNLYLSRYAWPKSELEGQIVGNPDLIVVIPAHNEPDLCDALKSLHQCDRPQGEVLIIVVINESTQSNEEIVRVNKATFKKATAIDQRFRQCVLHLQLPPKKAGVGLARKIGMDEAVRIFESQGKDGIIVCYDADCTCDTNYLSSIEDYYAQRPSNLGVVHYEHVLHGDNHFPIVNYELYLRYYINALRFARYPYAFQTLGSCITVKSSAYQKQGGMNQRKAGEDFYFIHKVMPLGKVGEINKTTIYPADRISDRVPFGTGHAVGKYIDDPDPDYPVYHYHTFEDLVFVNQNLDIYYETQELPNIPETIKVFYKENDFDLKQLIKHSGGLSNFTQRYYQWWDGFRTLKFVHFCRDHFYPKINLDDALRWLSEQASNLDLKDQSREEQLLMLRDYDRNQEFYIK